MRKKSSTLTITKKRAVRASTRSPIEVTIAIKQGKTARSKLSISYNTKKQMPQHLLFLVTSVAVVCRFVHKSQICFKTRTLGDTAHENNRSGCFLFANIRERPHGYRRGFGLRNKIIKTKKQTPQHLLFVLVTRTGIEPMLQP